MKKTLRVSVICMFFGMSFPSYSDEVWLQPAVLKDWGGPLRQIPKTNYLDLGSDPNAVSVLVDKNFVVDPSNSGGSLALSCEPPSKRYLVRSLYVGNLSAAVYEGANGLIISVGSFSEPRTPSKGAIAICLTNAPIDVRGGVGFAK